MISVIGVPQTGSALDGANVTLTFSVAPAEGDVVVVFGGHPHRASTNLGPTGGTYTTIATHTAAAPNFGAWYKVMTSSPDTNVVCQGTGDATDGTAYCCYVLRGVDNTTVLDVAATTAGPTTSTNPNNPSITPTTVGALVMALAGSQVTDTAPGTVAGYNRIVSANANDNNDISTAGAILIKAPAGAEDPAAWSAWASGAWYGITVALRPESMSIGVLQKASKQDNGAANTTLAFPTDVTAGSLLVVSASAWESGGTNYVTPTDTLGHTYTAMVTQQAGTDERLGIWYVANATGGANTVTFDLVGAASGDLTVMVSEFSGIATTTPLDQTAAPAQTFSATPTSGDITPTENGELLIGSMTWGGSDATIAEETGWTSICDVESGTSGMPLGVQAKIQVTAAAEDADWTISAARDWLCNVGSFKAAAAAVVSALKPLRSLLGVGT